MRKWIEIAVAALVLLLGLNIGIIIGADHTKTRTVTHTKILVHRVILEDKDSDDESK